MSVQYAQAALDPLNEQPQRVLMQLLALTRLEEELRCRQPTPRMLFTPRSNCAAVNYVRAIAAAEGLDLDVRLANQFWGNSPCKDASHDVAIYGEYMTHTAWLMIALH